MIRYPLAALRDAIFLSSMKPVIPGLTQRQLKLLKRAECQGLLVAIPMIEYMTSNMSNQDLSIFQQTKS